jgi:O-antigen/teichoic acid export membrane protein
MLQRALRNASFTGLAAIGQLVIGLLLVTNTIRVLGNARAGYLLTVQAVLAVGSVMGGFGFAPAATRRLAMLIERNELPRARKCVEVISLLAATAGVLIALAVILNGGAIVRWSAVGAEYAADATLATVLMAGAFAVQQAGSVYASVYTGAQRFDLAALVNTSYALVTNSLGLVIVHFWPSLTHLATLTLCTSTVLLVVNAGLARRLLKAWLVPRWHSDEFGELRGFAGWAYVGSLGSLLVSQMDRVMITSLLGSAAVAIYALPQRIVQALHSVMADQVSVLFPMLSGRADREADMLERISDRVRWLTASAAVFAYGGLSLVAVPMLALLVSPEFAARSRWILCCAMLQGAFSALRIVPYYLSWAMGDARPNTIAISVQGFSTVALMVVLIPRFGVVGAAISQLVVIPVAIGNALWVGRMIRNKSTQLRVTPELSPYYGPGLASLVFLVGAVVQSRATDVPGVTMLSTVLGTFALAIFAWSTTERFAAPTERRFDILRSLLSILNQRTKRLLTGLPEAECEPVA